MQDAKIATSASVYDEVSSKTPGSKQILPFIAVAVIAAALRLYQLSTESLWVDEGASIRDAIAAQDIAGNSKPLYYWFLSFWIRMGDSDWFLRLPSVIFGIMAVALVYLLGSRIWGRRAGFMAGMLAAVSPIQVNHSQEVRMYSLMMMLSLAAFYSTTQVLRTWSFRWMLVTGICTYLAILTHPMCALMLLPQNIVMLDSYLRKRRSLILWSIVQVGVIAAWTPFIPSVPGPDSTYHTQAYLTLMPRPSLGDVPRTWAKFLVAEWAGVSVLYKVYSLYTFVITLFMSAVLFMNRRKLEVRLLGYWLILPPVAALILLHNSAEVWVPRHILFVSSAVYLLLGAAMARFYHWKPLLLISILLFTLPLVKLGRYYVKTYHPEWRQAVAYIQDHEKPGDTIALYRGSSNWVFRHYYKGRAAWTLVMPKQFLKDPRSEFEPWDHAKALTIIGEVPKGDRQWLAISRTPPGADYFIDKALSSHVDIIDVRQFTDVKLYLFTRNNKHNIQDSTDSIQQERPGRFYRRLVAPKNRFSYLAILDESDLE